MSASTPDQHRDAVETRLSELVAASERMVFFGGAGMSTESGIPDFRSEAGLYAAQSQYGHRPEELLSRDFFDEHPREFFDYYVHNLVHPEARANPGHLALARWEREGRLACVVTQNIDGLHQRAGSTTVHELHGSVLRNYCMDCRRFYPVEFVLAGAAGPGGVPRCEACAGIVKPDVVLYGEPLDDAVMRAAVRDITAADTLIVGGTSLAVYPAAGLIRYYGGDALVLINLSATAADSYASLVIHAPLGQVLGRCAAGEGAP